MAPRVESPSVRELDENGYLIVENVLDPERDLDPVLEEFEGVLDRLASSLYDAGKIKSRYAGPPFARRLVEVTRASGRSLSRYFDVSLQQEAIYPDTPIHLGPACFRLLVNPRLLDLVEQFVGGEILVSPIGHVRMKVPHGSIPGGGDPKASAAPWHQDNGVILEEADRSNILTVWIPLTESTVQNGCMHVVPTARSGELITHCPAPVLGVHIPDRHIDVGRAVTLPMRAGSVLLMHSRTIHGSLENSTADQIRTSMDLRYQPVDEPTGRPMYPGFIARSRSSPHREFHDPRQWAQMWLDARTRLAGDAPPAFNRWDGDSPGCA